MLKILVQFMMMVVAVLCCFRSLAKEWLKGKPKYPDSVHAPVAPARLHPQAKRLLLVTTPRHAPGHKTALPRVLPPHTHGS